MRKSYVLLLLLIISNLSVAQINRIKGLVLDENKEPLAACMVINPEKDTVLTDVEGKFEIKGSIGDSLILRLAFYGDTVIRIQDTSSLIVILRENETYDLCISAIFLREFYSLDFFSDIINTSHYVFEFRYTDNIYMDLGISYIRWDENYISFFSQFNDFYTYKLGWIILSPYFNVGINFNFKNFVFSPRFDLGLEARVFYSKYFRLSISSQLLTGVYGIGYFVGFTLTRRDVWETGWCE